MSYIKTTAAICTVAWMLLGTGTRSTVPESTPEPTPNPTPYVSKYTDDTKYPYFYGRLYIDSVGINVALYRDQDNKQAAVDRKDSACFFHMSNGGWIIADHNTQDFGALHRVKVGMEARIVTKDGTVKKYSCVEVLDGINTGHGITNKNGRVEHGRYDLLMYTCKSNWQDVRICHWEQVLSEGDQ